MAFRGEARDDNEASWNWMYSPRFPPRSLPGRTQSGEHWVYSESGNNGVPTPHCHLY